MPQSSSPFVLPLFLLSLLFVVDTFCRASDPVARRSGDDNRRWSNGVGLWGKRSVALEEDSGRPHLIALWGLASKGIHFVHRRRPGGAHSWQQQLNDVWGGGGKRSAATNWEKANNLWGKRR